MNRRCLSSSHLALVFGHSEKPLICMDHIEPELNQVNEDEIPTSSLFELLLPQQKAMMIPIFSSCLSTHINQNHSVSFQSVPSEPCMHAKRSTSLLHQPFPLSNMFLSIPVTMLTQYTVCGWAPAYWVSANAPAQQRARKPLWTGQIT